MYQVIELRKTKSGYAVEVLHENTLTVKEAFFEKNLHEKSSDSKFWVAVKKWIIDTNDETISGSGCDELFDRHSDAEFHMRNYTEEEKKHLVIDYRYFEVDENGKIKEV